MKRLFCAKKKEGEGYGKIFHNCRDNTLYYSNALGNMGDLFPYNCQKDNERRQKKEEFYVQLSEHSVQQIEHYEGRKTACGKSIVLRGKICGGYRLGFCKQGRYSAY